MSHITIHGMRSSTLEWCVPCMPSCLKILVSSWTIPSFCSHFTVLCICFNQFLCFVPVVYQPHFPFLFYAIFTIKTLVHSGRKGRSILPLGTCHRDAFAFTFHPCDFITLLCSAYLLHFIYPLPI